MIYVTKYENDVMQNATLSTFIILAEAFYQEMLSIPFCAHTFALCLIRCLPNRYWQIHRYNHKNSECSRKRSL